MCLHKELLKIRWLGSDLGVNSTFKKSFLANLTDLIVNHQQNWYAFKKWKYNSNQVKLIVIIS